MASYDTLEKSTEQSRPIELYQFVIGSTEYRFTSAEDNITIGSSVYTADAIARSRIEQGSDANNRTLTITMPSLNAIAQRYISVPPGEKCTVNVFRYQRDEPSLATQLLLFKGQVQSVRFPNDGHSAEFAIRSIETALNRNIPRFTFMGMCNHILYDNACGVDQGLFDHLGEALSIDGTTVEVQGLNASGIDFVGGYVRPAASGVFRMVLAQSGDFLTMLLPFAVDPTGSNVQAFAGCDHVLTGDCALVFDNVAEFGGFAFVPNRNIFQTGL